MKKLNVQLLQRVILIGWLLFTANSWICGQQSSTNTALKSTQEALFTASFTMSETDDRVVSDMGDVKYTLRTNAEIPLNAKVTHITYSITIDDNGNEMNFFPKNYEIWLSSESHAGYTFLCVYDNQGHTESNVDEGFDDDASNDTDIFLNTRTTNAFEHEDADQFYTVMVRDNVTGGVGKVTSVSLTVHYEAPNLPNFNVDRTPSGWSAPIVVTYESDSYTQESVIYAGVNTYLKFALYNSSNYDCVTPFIFQTAFNAHTSNLTLTRIDGNEFYPVTALNITFEEGRQTVCDRVDPAGVIDEMYEDDNEHCISFNVIGPPVAPALISPSNSLTCQATDLTISWSTSENAATYQLQVDDNSDFSSPFLSASLAGTSRHVEGLAANTKYYWRVRGSNPAGNGSYSASRSFTTAPGAPAIPSLSNPANGSLCQPTSVALDWNNAANATSYALRVDNNSDFSSPVVNQSGIGLSEYTASGLTSGTTYYWQVATSNGCKTSLWSEARSFKVSGTPSVPSLSSPTANSTCQPTNLNLSWNTVSGATVYDIRVDDNSDYSSLVVNQTDIASTSHSISGLNEGTKYYWAVRARNSCGNSSAWSDSKSFTTAPSVPATPSPSSPSNSASCQSLSVTIGWNSVSGASNYSLQVDNNNDFSSPLINLNDLTTTEYPTSGLSESTTYYWRIAASNTCDASSSWSPVRSFSTTETPSVPSLAGPSNGATCQSTNLTLSWNSASGAASYEIKVDDNSDFSSPLVNESGITATTASISGLSPGTKYYWQVRAGSGCETTSSWSGSWSFTTAVTELEIPSPAEPAGGETCQPLSLALSWNEVIGAGGYTLQVDDNSDFSSPFYNQSDISAASQTVEDLSEGVVYYWRIKASNGCGAESSWSSASSFTTRISSIDIPTLDGPADNAECQPLSPVLSWGNVTNAVGYSLQVDNDSDFGSPVYTTDCPGTSHNCHDFIHSTTYYWRVSAEGNCNVTGSWSDIRSFKTGTGELGKPLQSSPADNSTGQPLALTLIWGNVANTANFRIQLDDNADFASPLYDEEFTADSMEVSGLSEGTTYYWQVMANGECASSDWSDVWQFQTFSITGLTGNRVSTGYSLNQNYPNPFSGTTTIEFNLPGDEYVNFEFYDLQGMLIKSWSGNYPAGKNTLVVSPDLDVSPGIYIYRMRTDDFTATKRCMLK